MHCCYACCCTTPLLRAKPLLPLRPLLHTAACLCLPTGMRAVTLQVNGGNSLASEPNKMHQG